MLIPRLVSLASCPCRQSSWALTRVWLRVVTQVDEHPTLAQPATFSLASVFSKAGLRVTAAAETTLTANQPRAAWEAKKKKWGTTEVVDRGVSPNPQQVRSFLDPADPTMTVTINAMEVKTFLVTVA